MFFFKNILFYFSVYYTKQTFIMDNRITILFAFMFCFPILILGNIEDGEATESALLKEEVSNLEHHFEEMLQRHTMVENLIKETEKEFSSKWQLVTYLQDTRTSLKEKVNRAQRELKQANEETSTLEKQAESLNAAVNNQNKKLFALVSEAERAEKKAQESFSKYEKLQNIVTEQWLYIQQLEQAVHMAEITLCRAEMQPKGKILQKLFEISFVFVREIDDLVNIAFKPLKTFISAHLNNIQILMGPHLKAFRDVMRPWVKSSATFVKPLIFDTKAILSQYIVWVAIKYQVIQGCISHYHVQFQVFFKQALQSHEHITPLPVDMISWYLASTVLGSVIFCVLLSICSLVSKANTLFQVTNLSKHHKKYKRKHNGF